MVRGIKLKLSGIVGERMGKGGGKLFQILRGGGIGVKKNV